MPDSPALRHKKNFTKVEKETLCTYTQMVMWKNTPCKLFCWYRNVGRLMLNLLYDTDKSLVNAGIPECQKKVSPSSAFFSEVNIFSPASVFRRQGQSGTAGYGLVRQCPAMLWSDNNFIFKFSKPPNRFVLSWYRGAVVLAAWNIAAPGLHLQHHSPPREVHILLDIKKSITFDDRWALIFT